MPKRLVPARDLLAGALARSGFREQDRLVFEAWDRILGPEAERARAVALKQRRLFIEVDTHVRLHTLTLRKRDLLKELTAVFGGIGPVSDIIMRLGTPSLSDEKHG